MARIAAIVLVLSVLAGCAKTYWTKPGLTPAEWNLDIYECERDMRQSGYFGGGFIGIMNARAFKDRCLVAKGYYKTDGDESTTPPSQSKPHTRLPPASLRP
jgi:hypothetical protein